MQKLKTSNYLSEWITQYLTSKYCVLNFYFLKSLLFIIKIGGFFMHEYFQIIRQALSEKREKGSIYYEAHHIVPKSFGKRSSTVLLTPEEHYRCHRLLAEYFKNHTTYGRKMLWAFHRISYDGKHTLTEEEYGEGRRILNTLWTKPKSEKHRAAIARAQVGNTNNKTRVYKGMKSDITQAGREKLAQVRKREQTGKVGLLAQAAKGPYTVEFEDGRKYTEGSYPELSKSTGIPYPTLQYRYVHKREQMLKGWRIY